MHIRFKCKYGFEEISQRYFSLNSNNVENTFFAYLIRFLVHFLTTFIVGAVDASRFANLYIYSSTRVNLSPRVPAERKARRPSASGRTLLV